MQARWVGFKQCWLTAGDDDTMRTWSIDGTQLQQFTFMGALTFIAYRTTLCVV